MGSSSDFLKLVRHMEETGMLRLECPIHGSINGRPLGEPRAPVLVCPRCFDSALSEYVGSVGGDNPFPNGASAATWKRFVADWQQRAMRREPRAESARPFFEEPARMAYEYAPPADPTGRTSVPPTLVCGSCGKPLQVASETEWKCGNVLCDVFCVPIDAGACLTGRK